MSPTLRLFLSKNGYLVVFGMAAPIDDVILHEQSNSTIFVSLTVALNFVKTSSDTTSSLSHRSIVSSGLKDCLGYFSAQARKINKTKHSEKNYYIFPNKSFSYISGNGTF